MISIADYAKEIVSLIVPLLTWFLNVGIKPRAKLFWTTRHAFTFLVQEPLHNETGEILQPVQNVRTASLKVMNAGRETAHKVELVFNWRPQYHNLWPVRSCEERTDLDGRFMLVFENLSPKEEIGIEILSVNRELPALLQVRSSECLAREVDLMWFVRISQWRIQVARLLMMVGLATAVYWTITLLQFLVLKTPLTS
jgi:hypothetical protein